MDFEIDGNHYPTAEHYIMTEKARLFNDNEVLQKILETSHPGDAKKLGRNVKGYEEEVWKKQRFDIAVSGNHAKFSQNEELKAFLINTGDWVLVEASPHDKIWGMEWNKIIWMQRTRLNGGVHLLLMRIFLMYLRPLSTPFFRR